MKVTGVKPWIVKVDWTNAPGQTEGAAAHMREFVFVQVDTDEGITGWGEITTYPGFVANRAIAAMTREMASLVVDEDPAYIERIWNKVFRAMTYAGTRGASCAVLSAIDIALWDIRGKALGLPVYMLLGGAVRDRIALYTHPPRTADPAKAAEHARQIVDNGYEAFKFDPFLHNIPEGNAAYLDGQISKKGEEEGVEITAAIREAVGSRVEMLIDAHGKYNVPTAIRLAQRLAPYDIHWFEEPCPPESYHALKQVREQIPMKVCVGERLHTRYDFVPVFEQNLSDYVMPDVTWTGGISELKKISTMAESYYIPVSPHDASGPINVISGAQVMMTVPNFYKLETSRYDLSSYNAFIDHPLDIREGHLHVSDRPGLGVNLDLEYLRAHAVEGFGG